MTDTEYEEIKRQFLTLYNLCAPNGTIQNAMIASIREIEREEESNSRRVKTLVGMLYDGLAYGNW